MNNQVKDSQQKSTNLSFREKFFSTLKTKYPNLHALYVTINIIGIWSGAVLISDSWAQGINLITEPTPEFSLITFMRHWALLMFGLFLLLIDDLSLKELIFMTKTINEKPVANMNTRERIFHNFKINHPNLSSIYNLLAIVVSWCGIWGILWGIPIQPFWRSLITIFLGFFLLYIDDLKLDEL